MTPELANGLLHEMGARVPSKLIEFGRALDAAFGDGEPLEWWYFLEKPHKWSSEYAAWVNLESPMPGDDGWAGFLAELLEA